MTVLHVKGSASNINVLGILEVQVSKSFSPSLIRQFFCLKHDSFFKSLVAFNCVLQELLAGGGANIPCSIHEVVAHLACRLARWDDRLILFTSCYQLRKILLVLCFV